MRRPSFTVVAGIFLAILFGFLPACFETSERGKKLFTEGEALQEKATN